jgi:galactokinase
MAQRTWRKFYVDKDKALSFIYGGDQLGAQSVRWERLIGEFKSKFGNEAGLRYVSAPGRVEIVGNHTDHNRGRVLAAAVNLDTVAIAAPCETNSVTLYSAGYPMPFVVDLDDLSARPEERETSSALIRGVTARMKALGYETGGFNAVVDSTVFKGSGLSSSAAFEVMICAALDAMYNGFGMDAKLRAKIAQYAENAYFGKPCGLMDQMASSMGGLVAIDFCDDDPAVASVAYDFEAEGYALAVVSAGGEHGSLTAEYARMPDEMKLVAGLLGGEALRDLDPAAIEGSIAALKGRAPDRAILRSLHFIDEDARVARLTRALEGGDLGAFFEGIIESGDSSWKLLQNIYVPGSDNQEMALALELSRRMLKGRGAWRIHGGGFAGTILAFVPLDYMDEYARRMDAVFGESSVTRLSIRSAGAAAFEARRGCARARTTNPYYWPNAWTR